jgi:hypothetical protein
MPPLFDRIRVRKATARANSVWVSAEPEKILRIVPLYATAASACGRLSKELKSISTPTSLRIFATRPFIPTSASFRPDLWHVMYTRTSAPTAVESMYGTPDMSKISAGSFAP